MAALHGGRGGGGGARAVCGGGSGGAARAGLAAAVALLLACTAAHAAVDARTGFIDPPPQGVPSFDPEAWNGGWQLTLRGVPRSGELWPAPKGLGVNVPSDCTRGDASATLPKGSPLSTCVFSTASDGDTYDLAIRLPGLARRNGNCLCFALDYFRGGYCLPGTSAGGAPRRRYRARMSCKALNDAVASDGAERVSREAALSGQPAAGHVVVMMARPDDSCVPGHCGGADFHVMRRDADGGWSWKLPNVPASNRDLAGARITDPEAALLPGHYTVCGYFVVQPQRMVIGAASSETGPLDDMSMLQPFRDAGASVSLAALPYDAATDGRVEGKNAKIFAEDLAWERQRGSAAYARWEAEQRRKLGMDGGGDGSSSSNGGNGRAGGSGSNGDTNSGGASGRRLARRLTGA